MSYKLVGRSYDMTGMVFGRWTVLSLGRLGAGRSRYWQCQCVCGVVSDVKGSYLRDGTSQSCGCLMLEQKTARFTKHGYVGKRVYRIWQSMIQRTTNPNRDNAYMYNGLLDDKRWLKFECFLADMGEPPTTGHSLDRIDGTKGYSKQNCRWATQAVQHRNKRSNRMITFNGKTQCLADWADELKLSRTTLGQRIRHGWPVEDAMTVRPSRHNSRYLDSKAYKARHKVTPTPRGLEGE